MISLLTLFGGLSGAMKTMENRWGSREPLLSEYQNGLAINTNTGAIIGRQPADWRGTAAQHYGPKGEKP